jgi:hypothetical protein
METKIKNFGFSTDLTNYVKEFARELKVNDVFTYDDCYFPQEISDLFEKNTELQVAYCDPKTEAYKKYGSQTMVVTVDNTPLTGFLKMRAMGALERESEKIKKEREVKDTLYKRDIVSEISFVGDDIAIVKTKSPAKDSGFYEGNPFYFQVVVKKAEWERLSEICFNFDEAILIALGFKYQGLNNQFAFFAKRMLI